MLRAVKYASDCPTYPTPPISTRAMRIRPRGNGVLRTAIIATITTEAMENLSIKRVVGSAPPL